jgi:hypothetical protein
MSRTREKGFLPIVCSSSKWFVALGGRVAFAIDDPKKAMDDASRMVIVEN